MRNRAYWVYEAFKFFEQGALRLDALAFMISWRANRLLPELGRAELEKRGMTNESATLKAKFFEQCMRLMRRRDGQSQEDGYHFLLPRASEFVLELLDEAMSEQSDPGLRSWLYELLRETKSPLAIEHYKSLLASGHEAERQWAVKGLQAIDTPESRKILFEARQQLGPRQ